VHEVFRTHWLIALAIGIAMPIAAGAESIQESPAFSAGRLTLADAVERVRSTNPELRAAAQEVEIARGALVKARYPSQFNPHLGGDGGHRSRSGPGGSGSATDYGIALSQEIEVAGQRGARIAEAEQTVARAEAEVRDRKRLLDADTKQAFFAVLIGARRVQLLEHIEELDRRVREAAAARATAGETSVIEANLAAIRYGQARKATLDADADLQAARATLRRLLNLDSSAPLEPVGDLPGRARRLTSEDAVARALELRPDLAAAGREVDRIDAERALTRRLAAPNPTIEAFYRKEDIEPNRIAGAGLRIPLPIFDRKQGELVTLAARQSQARFQVDAVRRRIEQEVVESLQRYQAAGRTFAVFEQDVLGRVDENFGFIETAYRAGKIDLLQLVVVQNDLVAAQLSYLDALARFRQSEVDLERAIGGPL
jgi:outer membrane protein, heavy metal efflux system